VPLRALPRPRLLERRRELLRPAPPERGVELHTLVRRALGLLEESGPARDRFLVEPPSVLDGEPETHHLRLELEEVLVTNEHAGPGRAPSALERDRLTDLRELDVRNRRESHLRSLSERAARREEEDQK